MNSVTLMQSVMSRAEFAWYTNKMGLLDLERFRSRENLAKFIIKINLHDFEQKFTSKTVFVHI